MCGITGTVQFDERCEDDDLENMVASLRHRGPNDSGVRQLRLEQAFVGFGHTRLSILDLSPAGQQPMTFGHVTVVFNGEVYNFRALRAELKGLGHVFTSGTDTEVLLHAYAEWGLSCVDRLNGMFAFAVLDESSMKLHLVRDRVGIKPLYYAFKGTSFLFGSELKSLMLHRSFERQVDRSVLPLFLELGYVPNPHSVFADAKKLEAGTILTLDLGRRSLSRKTYWSPDAYYQAPKRKTSLADAKVELEELLFEACRDRLVSDVPLGVFLSGGYDSSAVAAMVQKISPRQIKTFTIGFDIGNNEAPFAKDTASYLGTDHQELVCTARQALDIVPQLPDIYDEPFADSSALPTTLLSRFAKQQVSVALSADGGDELFAGYHDYTNWRKYDAALARLPGPCRYMSGAALGTLAAIARRWSPHRGHQMETAANALRGSPNLQGARLYRGMRRLPDCYGQGLLNTQKPRALTAFDDAFSPNDPREEPMLLDFVTYLPDDILVKVDRASMSASLEARTPLLDHRVFEYVASLPFEFKFCQNISKKLLKMIVHSHVPESLLNRPKKGFSIPLAQWLRNELRDVVYDTLSGDSLKKSGLLEPSRVDALLRDFERGRLHYIDLIWKVFVLEQWAQRWLR